MKILTLCAVIAFASLAGCATDTSVDEPTRVYEPAVDSTDLLDPAPAPNARQDGKCCNARCANGGHGINLPLTSGCTTWAESFCRNAWVPSSRLVDAWWGGC
jgi:hypothetical protein